MKRLHVHVSVADLNQSIQFYSTLFGAQPTKQKDDYAKWMLEDPRVNFAISTNAKAAGSAILAFRPKIRPNSTNSRYARRQLAKVC